MKKYNLVLGMLICVTFILTFVRIVVLNRISTSGLALDKINEEISSYKTKNDILSETLLSYSSFSNLATQAARLGFIEDRNSFILTGTLPLAKR